MIIGTSPLPKEGGIVYKTKATPEAYARMMQFNRAVRYFWRNKEELTAQYPNLWVAVSEDGVIDTAATSKELIKQLDDGGVPSHAAVIEFLNTEPRKLILSPLGPAL